MEVEKEYMEVQEETGNGKLSTIYDETTDRGQHNDIYEFVYHFSTSLKEKFFII